MLIYLDPREINMYVWFIVHIKETMVSVPVHVFASLSNCSDLAFHCFSWAPTWS